MVLFRNRNILHYEWEAKNDVDQSDKAESLKYSMYKEHLNVKAKYGGLYLQYDERAWWFEGCVIMNKMCMTGALYHLVS